MLQLPGVDMRDVHCVQTGGHSGIDVAARTVADHPAMRFHNFVLVHQRRIRLRIFFGDNLDRFKKSLQSRALHFSGLFRGLALRKQNQPVFLRQVRQRLWHSIQNLRRCPLQFHDSRVYLRQNRALRHLVRQLQVSFFQRPPEAPHSIPVLPDILALRLVQDVPNVRAAVAAWLDQRNKVFDKLFEKNIVFPERIVGVNQQCFPSHRFVEFWGFNLKLRTQNLLLARPREGLSFTSTWLATTARSQSGRLALSSGQFFQNSPRHLLQFAKARQVLLKFLVQRLGVLRTQFVPQDHIPQFHRMRQQRLFLQFFQCLSWIVVIHPESPDNRSLSAPRLFTSILRGMKNNWERENADRRSTRIARRSRGGSACRHKLVTIDARGDSHSAVIGGVHAHHFSVALDVDVSSGNDLLRQRQHEIYLGAFFESSFGVKIEPAVTYVARLRLEFGTIVVARQNAHWQGHHKSSRFAPVGKIAHSGPLTFVTAAKIASSPPNRNA